MRPLVAVSLVLVFLVLLVLANSFYVVREWDQVVITQFGEPKGDPIREAGLHFKTPFVQQVNRFDKRVLEWDGERNQVPTSEKRYIWVDTTARWRIADPLRFLQSVINETGAQGRLDDIIDTAVRDVVGSHALIEVVRLTNRVTELPRDPQAEQMTDAPAAERIEFGREKLEDQILDKARGKLSDLGIELIDVRFRRVNYEESVRRSVYDRMKSERERIAEQYRSEGRGLEQEIAGRRQRELLQISSEAERDAQITRADADEKAAKLYADAFGRDEEFYAFWRSLQAYEQIVGENTTLVVSPRSELYRYLVAGMDVAK